MIKLWERSGLFSHYSGYKDIPDFQHSHFNDYSGVSAFVFNVLQK